MTRAAEAAAVDVSEPRFFRTLERELEISSDSAGVLAFFETVFGRMSIPRPTGFAPLDSATLAHTPAVPRVSFNERPIALGAELPAHPSVYRFAFSGSHRVFRESFAENAAWFNFHGAAVAIGGRALAIVAPPASGKTMLALALVARGASLYSDEFVFVRRADRLVSGYLANPFLREPAVAPLGIANLDRLCALTPGRPSARGWQTWYEFAPETIFERDVAAAPAPLAAVLVLDVAAPADRPTPMPSTLAAVDLARRLNGRLVGFNRLADVADLVAGIPAYRMSVDALPRAADALLELLG